jgi:hypothetical protein
MLAGCDYSMGARPIIFYNHDLYFGHIEPKKLPSYSQIRQEFEPGAPKEKLFRTAKINMEDRLLQSKLA